MTTATTPQPEPEVGRCRRDAGMTTVQLAVIFPVVLLWLLLIVQYGLWWHAKQVANAAAAEAVATARVPTGTDTAADHAARSFLTESGNLTNIAVTVERSTDAVTVTVTGNAPQLVPGFGWGVTSTSRSPLEQLLDPDQR